MFLEDTGNIHRKPYNLFFIYKYNSIHTVNLQEVAKISNNTQMLRVMNEDFIAVHATIYTYVAIATL